MTSRSRRLLFTARTVLFDWDGTLLDSYAADARAYAAMFAALGIEWNEEMLARHYSPDWYRVYRAARIPRAHWPKADRVWRRAYARETSLLLPGARKTIQSLARNFQLGIVSSGSRARVRKQIRALELHEYFSACVCAEDAERRKPHPAPLHLALKRLRARADDCVYVGDTPEDIEMARRAGMRVIGVRGPFPSSKRLHIARPDLLMDSVAELPKFLQRLKEK